jgi:hypothetical protein
MYAQLLRGTQDKALVAKAKECLHKIEKKEKEIVEMAEELKEE